MCQRFCLLFLSLILVQAIYSQTNKYNLSVGNKIQNVCKDGYCLNINTIGNGNTTAVTISIDKINDFLKKFEQMFSKIAKAQEDRLFKRYKASINEIKTNITAPGLVNSQFKSTELSDSLADKYLIDDNNYSDYKKEIFKNYITIKPLSCNLNKVRITEIDNEKFYLAENINITYDDITLNETKNSNIIPFKFKNKYGFINKNGEIIVSPQYDSVIASDKEYIWVYKSNLFWGFVDSVGKVCKKFYAGEYETVHPFYDNRALIKNRISNNGNSYCFINKQWELVAGPYKYAYDFSYGKACIANLRPDSSLINYFDLDTLGQYDQSVGEYIRSADMYDTSFTKARMNMFSAVLNFRNKNWSRENMISAIEKNIYLKYDIEKKLGHPKGWKNFKYVRLFKAIAESERSVDIIFGSIDLILAIDSICKKWSTCFFYLNNSIQASYIDTTGKCITGYYSVALPFDYQNLARVGNLDINKGANKLGINYYLIDHCGSRKGTFFTKSLCSPFLNYTFPISNFKERWATCDNLIVDSSGEASYKLEEGISFAGQFDNGIFIIKKVYANSGLIHNPEKYGLINQDGLEILPPVYKNITIINSYLAKAENFEGKILYYNITSRGMIKLLK